MGEKLNKEAPNFIITRTDWIKIQQYARYAYDEGGNEIGGMMVLSPLTWDDREVYQLHHPVILEQEISAGNTVLTAEALAVHYGKMADKFGSKIRHVWWHSHHKMGAFWSGTDDDTIMGTKSPDFTVSLVINLYQDYKLRVQWFKPFEHEENVPLQIIDKPLLKEVTKSIANEVDKLCSERKAVVKSGWSRGVGSPTNIRHYMPHNRYDTQMSLLNDPWDDPGDPQFPHMPEYMTVYDFMDDLLGKYISGEIRTKEFNSLCSQSNQSLKESNSSFRIKILPKKKLQVEVYSMNPRDFITRGGRV